MEGRLFLHDDELDAGAALVLALEKRLQAATEAAMARALVNRAECELLMAVRAFPGLTVSQMRERLAMTVPTFARLLGGLDRRGLIVKGRAGRDGRARTLSLSEAGKMLTAPIAQALRDVLRPAFRTAGAENVAGWRAVLQELMEAGHD